jgi:hypothetical protein
MADGKTRLIDRRAMLGVLGGRLACCTTAAINTAATRSDRPKTI